MDQKDKERLIKIETDVSWLRAGFTIHLSEHFKVKILVIGSAIAAASALLIALI